MTTDALARRFVGLGALLLVLAGCQDEAAPPVVNSMELPAPLLDEAGRSVPVSIRVLDDKGQSIGGIEVRFAPTAGGSVDPGSAVTDAEGAVSTVWTLGSQSGNQVLRISSGSFSQQLTADVAPGDPASVVILSGSRQAATVGTALPLAVEFRVVDRFGNAVPGVAVSTALADPDGVVSSPSVVSDSLGRGGLTWILGGRAGEQLLILQASGSGEATVSATGLRGDFAKLEKISGMGQEGTVDGVLLDSIVVATTDGFGNPVPGVTVSFSATGGSVSLAEGVSGPDGMVSTVWGLGQQAGPVSVVVSAVGAASVSFSATARAGLPSVLGVVSGNQQAATVGSTLGNSLVIMVTDEFGNPVAGATVFFSADPGDGSTNPSSAVTDSQGTATTQWTLGVSAGAQRAVATVAELGLVQFQATALAGGGGGGGGGSPSAFNLEVRFVGTPSAGQVAAFENARQRWASIIVGDLQDGQVTLGQGACGVDHPAMNEVVDDLVIWVILESIDGPGGVLGSAGPCLIRGSGFLPLVGTVHLDSDDLAQMESAGTLTDVILHEMGHVLGIGTLWATKGLLVDAGSADPYFNGAAAQGQFAAMGGVATNSVPVENTGGPGTRDGHWRESILGRELMTGWIGGSSNPLSGLTIASLQDLGFAVNIGAGDGLSLTPESGLWSALMGPRTRLIERPAPPPMIAGGAGGSDG